MADLALRSRHVVTPDGVIDAVVVARGGRIVAIDPVDGDAHPAHPEAVDVAAAWLIPGVVDTHVHVNEPGRTMWEGFATATRAAAAGGVTTIVDMPLNSVPATTTRAALEAKRAASEGKRCVDVGFWGGVVPGNAAELPGLVAAGALGFKCFLVPSGVDEFPRAGADDLAAAMPVIARLGVPLLVHAELPGPIDDAARAAASGDPRRHATWLASRPPAAEVEAVRLVIDMARATGCRVHVVHLAAAECLDDLRRARRDGVPITVETCPHYLALSAEDVADGDTLCKCAPPLRGSANRERLWKALAMGDIDLVASDHSPCPPDMKLRAVGDFMAAWGGIASLELSLAVTWTEARGRGRSMEEVVRWMCERPARLAGLDGRKGRIVVGHDADLVAWEPDHEWSVVPERLHQRHPVTPYAGRRLAGRVRATYLRGAQVFDGERIVGEPAGATLTL